MQSLDRLLLTFNLDLALPTHLCPSPSRFRAHSHISLNEQLPYLLVLKLLIGIISPQPFYLSSHIHLLTSFFFAPPFFPALLNLFFSSFALIRA